MADRLRHMLDAIADVQIYIKDKSFDEYLADHMRRHAIERCLEIVSEASRYVPREVKARHTELPWRGVADFGNVLRHDYPSVKHRRVWEIVTKDLAPLKVAVETILHDLERKGERVVRARHGRDAPPDRVSRR